MNCCDFLLEHGLSLFKFPSTRLQMLYSSTREVKLRFQVLYVTPQLTSFSLQICGMPLQFALRFLRSKFAACCFNSSRSLSRLSACSLSSSTFLFQILCMTFQFLLLSLKGGEFLIDFIK